MYHGHVAVLIFEEVGEFIKHKINICISDHNPGAWV
jgi:hypothetical protein